MSSDRQKQKIFRPFAGLVAVVALCVSVFILGAFQTPIQARQDAGTAQRAAVPKGVEPIEIIATVVAMSRGPCANVGWSFYLLLFRVDKVVGGNEIAQYVRADFPSISVHTSGGSDDWQ